MNLNGAEVEVESSDVEIISEDIPGWQVANDGSLTVALDVTLTDELRKEGIARDIVNRVQNIRKGRDYDIVDKIKLTFEPNEVTDEAIKDFADYISRQVLASSLTFGEIPEGSQVEELDLDGVKVRTVVELAN